MTPAIDPSFAAAVQSYADGCRARIPGFAARHFGWGGSLRLHRSALGLDLLRAPLNVLLVGPTLFVRLAAMASAWLGWRRAGAWLAVRNLFVETDLARRMADLTLSELLSVDDAQAVLPKGSRQRVRDLIAEYLAARHAIAELAAGLVTIAVGLALVQALTPSAITLGPLLAREFAQREAIESFWLGSWAGAIWQGWYPADASWLETIATTAAVMACFALVATFMGLLTDPLLQMLGMHRRRLGHLVDTLERVALGNRDASLGLPDLYVARLTDVVDVILLSMRMTR